MPRAAAFETMPARYRSPADRQYAFTHLEALEPVQECHAEQRLVEIFDDCARHIVDRQLLDADFAQHYRDEARRAIGGLRDPVEDQSAAVEAGRPGIVEGQSDEARAGI